MQLPMYQNVGKTAIKKDLNNTIALCAALDNPQDDFKSIHIAGTNGKGSTAHILSAIYQNNGYKVGLYTSPHLIDFRERIKVNGMMCDESFVVDFVEKIKDQIEEIQPSFFEITVAMAFTYFSQQNVDVAIIETGLGGRLDSTNIITPICSVFTPIGMDHMEMLGHTLELIAQEKAGIIKKNVPLVTVRQDAEAFKAIKQKATDQKARIFTSQPSNYKTDLVGEFQRQNIGNALKVEKVLQEDLPTSIDKSKEAVTKVEDLTNFHGRWQTLNEHPLVVCDVGHNIDGFKTNLKQLSKYRLNVHFVLGFVKGRDLKPIIEMLPADARYAIVKPNVVRGRDANDVAKLFLAADKKCTPFVNTEHAIHEVFDAVNKIKEAIPTMIFISGSNFTVADVLHLKAEGKLPF